MENQGINTLAIRERLIMQENIEDDFILNLQISPILNESNYEQITKKRNIWFYPL